MLMFRPISSCNSSGRCVAARWLETAQSDKHETHTELKMRIFAFGWHIPGPAAVCNGLFHLQLRSNELFGHSVYRRSGRQMHEEGRRNKLNTRRGVDDHGGGFGAFRQARASPHALMYFTPIQAPIFGFWLPPHGLSCADTNARASAHTKHKQRFFFLP